MENERRKAPARIPPAQQIGVQAKDRRGGGSGGLVERKEGNWSARTTWSTSTGQGFQVSGGPGGSTAPALAHKVECPWHCRAVTPRIQPLPFLVLQDDSLSGEEFSQEGCP